MSDYTPTVVGVRAAYLAGADPVFSEDGRRTDYRTQTMLGFEFDRWLAEHDHAVLTRWEMTRKPDPIVIENIQGEPAAAWLARTKADVWDEAVLAASVETGAALAVTNPYRES